ncbi:uncharacterized protein LOC108734139 isoform X2 [Agrilus planipennis]|uniref:Uncharacterized protein LOC108734139 isoform X2 n=1 Tax=Agrilus planipennis TaxID=224129 RepID=A0A7F5RF31_AGRPL|nr:uncharacterized protein LOC108734139 isoform X2 [Agrilus planipennis]
MDQQLIYVLQPFLHRYAKARILQLINYNSNQSGVKVLYFNEHFQRRPSSTSYLEAETELEIFHIPNFDELPASLCDMGQSNVAEIDVVHSRVPQLQQPEIVTVRTSSFKRAWKGIKNAFTFKKCRH